MMRLLRLPGLSSGLSRLGLALFLVALSGSVDASVATAQGRNGFYLRGDLGDADALTPRGTLEGVDQPTRCDRLLFPDPATAPADATCAGFAPGVFATTAFDHGAETNTSATALAIGYGRGWLRLEAELNSTALGGTSAPLLDAGSLATERGREWSAVEPPLARVSGFSITDLFLNVHLDINNSSRFTPFIGFGGGVSTVVLVYEGLRVRETLAGGFTPAGGVDPTANTGIPAWQTRAAGTVDSVALPFAESTLGTNLIGGVAFRASERWDIALRGRYARYRDVRQSGEWDLLRSHAPVLTDGTTAATLDLVLSHIEFYAVTVSFVYSL